MRPPAVLAAMQSDLSGIARVGDLLVGGILFLLALVSPRHHEQAPATSAAHA
jgi:hypothetical protein